MPQGEAEAAHAEERVPLDGSAEVARELVPSHVQRADGHGPRGHCLHDGAVRAELDLFGGKRAARQVEEFCPVEPDPVRSLLLDSRELLGHLQIGAQRDRATVPGDAARMLELREMRVQLLVPPLFPPVLLENLGLGVEHGHAARSVHQRRGALAGGIHRAPEADDGRDSARAGHDRRVRRATAQIGREAKDLVAGGQRHLAGWEIGGHDQGRNLELAPRLRADAAQLRQHAAFHVAHVDRALAGVFPVGLVQPRRHGPQHPPVAVAGALQLARHRLQRALDRLGVVQDLELSVEDRGVLLARLGGDLVAEGLHLGARGRDRLPEAGLFLGNLPGGNRDRGHLDLLGIHDVDGPDADAGRGGDAGQDRHSSPNLLSTTFTRPASASTSSGPSVRSRISAPRSAASIMTPRMLFPFTSSPSRATMMCETYLAASLTKTEHARA